MKIFLFFIFIFYLLSVCFPQVTNPVVICTVKFNDKPLEGVSVLVKGTIEESELLTTGSAGKVNLTLNINDNYRVEIFKPGFIKQRIEISTKIIGSIDGFLPYNINLSLFRMFTGLDTSFFRKSLFKFQIDSKKKVFEEDLAYKNVLKKDFEAFKKKYDFALNNDIIFNTKAGDKELAENRYEDAWLFYDKAFQLKPENKNLYEKISEVKKMCLQKFTIDAGFQRNVSTGDEMFNKNNTEAKKYYEKSLLYKPEAKYPQERIREIEDALSNFGYMKKTAISSKIKQADIFIKDKKYKEAINIYEEILTLDNSNQFAKNKIEELKKYLNNDNFANNLSNSEVKINIEALAEDAHQKEISGDKKGASVSFAELGKAYYRNGRYDLAVDQFIQALKYTEQSDDKRKNMDILSAAGDVFASALRYDMAINSFEKILKIKEEMGDNVGQEQILSKIGNIYFTQKDYMRSIEYYKKSLAIEEKTGDKRNAANSLNNIGVAYYETGNFEKSVECYEKALRMLEEVGSKREVAQSLNNLGNVNFDWKKFSKALDYYKKSLKYKEELHYEHGIVISLYNIGNVYAETADYNNAIEFYSRSRDLSEKLNLTPYVYLNNKALGKAFYKIKNYKRAYECLTAAKSSGELMLDDKIQKQISEIHFKYDALKGEKEKKIEYLEKTVFEQNLWMQFMNEKKIKEDELYTRQKQIQRLKLRNEKLWSYSLLTGFVLLGIIVLIIFNRYRIKKRANKKLERANREIVKEKNKSEELLLNILPLEVANDLKEKGFTEPVQYDKVAVFFSDIVGFTKKSIQHTPREIINELNLYFSGIDEIIGKHNCERIKTMGDAYLAVCGLPVPNDNFIENIVRAALDIIKYTEERNKTAFIPWEIRVGVHTGEVVGGVVGIKKYIFDVFGDTINTAARLESACVPMKINVSEEIFEALKGKFVFTDRGLIDVKGKGPLRMYFLEREI